MTDLMSFESTMRSQAGLLRKWSHLDPILGRSYGNSRDKVQDATDQNGGLKIPCRVVFIRPSVAFPNAI